jgi:mono/diheme cytochrome c family protein
LRKKEIFVKGSSSRAKLAIASATAAFIATFACHAAAPSLAATSNGNGKSIFDTNCATCHQENGKGQPGVFPPLAGNPDVNAKDPTELIKTVLGGLNTPKTIEGKEYSGGMPAWKATLNDADIAAVLTYIRSAWGNKAPAVTEAQVKAVSKR